MQIKRILVMLSALLVCTNSYALNFLLLNNSSNLSLVYDKFKDAGNCQTSPTRGTIAPSNAINISISDNLHDSCIWSFSGYKIFQGDQYIGYLSINVSHGSSAYLNGPGFSITKTWTNGKTDEALFRGPVGKFQ